MYKKLKLTTISELIKNIYCSLSVLIIGCASAYAVEFNKDLIEAEDRENVNLSQFETDGQLPVGKYYLNALINNKRTPIHLDLQWVLIDNQTAVCLTPEQLTLLNFGIMVLLGHFLTTIYMPLIMHHIRAIIHKI